MTSKADSWFRHSPSRGKIEIRLFCFPFAGGNTSIYQDWAARLPPQIQVEAVALPGRGARLKETPFVSLPPLIDELVVAIEPLLGVPFAFFGHSMGALIAFELARRLRLEHKPEPQLLIASGHRAPQIPDTNPLTYNLPREAFIAELLRIAGTPKEVLEHAEVMDMIIPLLRADFQLVETYEYLVDAPLECPLTAFGGLQDPEVTQSMLLPWAEQTRATFKLRMMPGDHFFLRSAQALLLQMLSQELQVISLST